MRGPAARFLKLRKGVKDGVVAILISTRLQAVAPGDDERNFTNVDGVQTQSASIQRPEAVFLHIDCGYFQVQGAYYKFGDFKQQGCISRRGCC